MSANPIITATRHYATPQGYAWHPAIVLVLGALLTLAVLALDLLTPRGIAGGVLYTLVVLLSLWLPWRSAPWLLAAFGTALTLVAFAAKSAMGGDPWAAILNRGLSVAAIWITATLCFLCVYSSRRLRDDEAALRAISDSAADAMIMMDVDGTIRRANRACERLFGYPPEVLIGNSIALLMPVTSQDLRRGLHGGSSGRAVEDGEFVARHRDGRTFPVRLSMGETWLWGRPVFTGFLHDLTEQRAAERKIERLQADLYQVARRCELGQMIGAVAHELNQPLSAVHNYVAAAIRFLPQVDATSPSELAGVMTKALRQIELASAAMRQIRGMTTRGDKIGRTAEDLNSLVEETLTFAVAGVQRSGARVTTQLASALPPCRINRPQIQQVLVTLVQNSIEAMDGCDRRDLRIRTEQLDDGQLQVSVADSGRGLPAEVQSRLFMPFVTTKPDGIGIGLSVSHGIVESHGGRLSASDNPGGGTIFRFTLQPA